MGTKAEQTEYSERRLMDFLSVIDIAFGKQRTFQQVLGVKQSRLAVYYRAACRIFQKKQYDEAADAFLYLTLLNPVEHSFWVNLALAEQLRGRQREAIEAFGMAALTDPSDPLPHVYAAESYLELNQLDEVTASLQLALSLGVERGEHQLVRFKVKELFSILKARHQKKAEA